MLCPYDNADGLCTPGVNFCAPGTRWLSTITPKMESLPPLICCATSRATSTCRRCCLLLLAWLQSTISELPSPAASSSLPAAATESAS
ncbi:hypothetical protein D3C72_1815300 [compost metagenome]